MYVNPDKLFLRQFVLNASTHKDNTVCLCGFHAYSDRSLALRNDTRKGKLTE